jgi:hypothetical protein
VKELVGAIGFELEALAGVSEGKAERETAAEIPSVLCEGPGGARDVKRILVGAIGFEPTTPCAQGRCATRLRYAPTLRLTLLSQQLFDYKRRNAL